jgi:hypothetical protein
LSNGKYHRFIEVELELHQKRAGFACPFLLTETAKSGFLPFAGFKTRTI